MEHQKLVLKAQLAVAGEFGRAVSVHGVQCHGALLDIFLELWKGHEIVVESNREKRRRRRRVKDGKGHEFLPDQDESTDEDDGGGEANESKSDVWKPKPFPPRVCLHSFSGPLQTLKGYLKPPSSTLRYPSKVFFSFSTTINARPNKGHLDRVNDTIEAVPDDNVLAESDLHTAAEIDYHLAQAVTFIGAVKGWERDDCVRQLNRNWRAFALGTE